MAKVQNTLIGRASGSVGGATFTTWKGINVLKSKPESVANPRTLGQISQRNRLSIMVAVYRLIALAISIGFKTRAVGKSAYNAFVSANITVATSVDASGNATLNYGALKVSLGTIGSTAITSINATAGDPDVEINFNNSVNPIGGAQNDVAYAVVYNDATQTWETASANIRADGTVDISLVNLPVSGRNLECYLFFKSDNDADTSDSVHLQKSIA